MLRFAQSRRIGFLFVVFVAMTVIVVPVAGANPTTVVLDGAEDPAIDVPAVQAAVDQGGVVKLRGTFDFGDESVSILTDVELRGPATVRGGHIAFAVGFDPSLPDGGDARHAAEPGGPVVVFQNLNFENAVQATIYVLATSGLTIDNCSFNDGTYASWMGPYGGHSSVMIHTGWAIWSPYQGDPSDVTGPITLKNNTFEGESRADPDGFIPFAHPNAVPMNGILGPLLMVGGDDVQVTVNNNHSRNAGWYHFAFADVHGADSVIEVRNNEVVNDSDHLAFNSVLVLAMMNVWTGEMYPGLSEIEAGDREVGLVIKGNRATFASETLSYTIGLNIGTIDGAEISNNKIDVSTTGSGACDAGIELSGVQEALVRNNKINIGRTCGDGNSGIAVWGDWLSEGSHRNTVKGNTITGVADYGLIVGDEAGFGMELSTENEFMNNNFRRLDAVEADAAFLSESAHNFFHGKEGDTVIDLGTDNTFKGKIIVNGVPIGG